LLFTVGTLGNKNKINTNIADAHDLVSSDYLLLQYLKMPVQCNGQIIPMTDCLDYLAQNSGKCKDILSAKSTDFFQYNDAKEYSVSISLAKNQICKVNNVDSVFAPKISEITLPSPDPDKDFTVRMEMRT
jgi:hypothetical protein